MSARGCSRIRRARPLPSDVVRRAETGTTAASQAGYAWLAAVVPETAVRFRTDDSFLAARLREAGVEVVERHADVEILSPGVAPSAPFVVVPFAPVFRAGARLGVRHARRLANAVAARVRAGRTALRLRRQGYSARSVVWDFGQPFGSRRGWRSRTLVEFAPEHALVVARRNKAERTMLQRACADLRAEVDGPLDFDVPQARYDVLVLLSDTAVLRVALGPGRLEIESQVEALRLLRGAALAPDADRLVPRLLGHGRSGLVDWSLEQRLPGATPSDLSEEVLRDCLDFLATLIAVRSERDPARLDAAAAVAASERPEQIGRLLTTVAREVDEGLADLPRGFLHGDFFRGNLLVERGRLSGVVDWDAAGPGGLPLVDLIHLLTMTRHRPEDEDWGPTLVQSVLPWAARADDALVAGYAARTGLTFSPERLRLLVLAYWLGFVAYQLRTHPFRRTQQHWLERNVDYVVEHIDDVSSPRRLRAVVAVDESASVPVGIPVRVVSLIAPMLNEAGHVGRLVADVAAQDYRGDLELIVADGGSTDGSVDELRRAAASQSVPLTILPNPSRWVSHGLNACIRVARGDLIVRVDCHSRYPSDYVSDCVRLAEQTDAWNVGGIVIPEGSTPMERAVACAMDSPFGGIGWTRSAATGGPVEVDTVTYGAFRPEAFRRAGLFDESLLRNQDDEFNLRLRRAGGRILLNPDIRVRYTPRGSLPRVFRQYYEYGLWKVPVMLKHRRVVSLRSLAPIGFVGSLFFLGILSFVFSPALWLLVAEAALYAAAALIFAVRAVRDRRESWSLLPRVLAAFPSFHVSYALGMAVGAARAIVRRLGHVG